MTTDTERAGLPDVYFGEVHDEDDDTLPEVEGNDDDDDEELDETPSDVVEILGFDPKDL